MRQTLLVLALVVAAANTAQAKMPGFVVEVVPESPVAAEPFQVVVHLEKEIPVEVFESLLGLYPAETPEQIQGVVLTRIGETTYSATLTIDEPGEWVIIAFPDRTGWSVEEVPEGYPDRIPVTVQADPATARLIGGGVVLLVLGLVMARFVAPNIKT